MINIWVPCSLQSNVTHGRGEGVVISPARAKSQGSNTSKAVSIAAVFVSFIKILVF